VRFKGEIERKKVDAKVQKAGSGMERLQINDLKIHSKNASKAATSKQLQAHEILCDKIRLEKNMDLIDRFMYV
jgi:hypothetical protein